MGRDLAMGSCPLARRLLSSQHLDRNHVFQGLPRIRRCPGRDVLPSGFQNTPAAIEDWPRACSSSRMPVPLVYLPDLHTIGSLVSSRPLSECGQCPLGPQESLGAARRML